MKKLNKIKKAVIAAAGFGTRFLPATKAQPKEMLTIVDKPVIQYIVEECVASGIEDIIIITGWHKKSIEDHFDYPFELEKRLEEAGKMKELEEVRKIADMANFIYVRQKGPYGNGTPILNAKSIVGNEPFVALFADDLFMATPPRIKQCIDVYEKHGYPVIAGLRLTNKDDVKKYGIPEIEHIEGQAYKINKIIEKPSPEDAPSNLALLGCYILTPEIFPILETQAPGKGGEIFLVDAIDTLSKKTPIYACELQNAKYYDCGNKLSYILANIDLAMQRDDLAPGLLSHIKKIVEQNEK